QWQLETVQDLAFHGHTPHTRGVADHERQQLGGGQFGGENDVALVLPVLVVDHDDGTSGGEIGDGVLDGIEDDGLLGVRSGRSRVGDGHYPLPEDAWQMVSGYCT